MSARRFNPGDRVRVNTGQNKGTLGTVTGHCTWGTLVRLDPVQVDYSTVYHASDLLPERAK